MLLGSSDSKYNDYICFLSNYDTEHTGGSLLQHLVETSILLNDWNCSEACVIAGLFHSIYNTYHNQNLIKDSPERKDIIDLIGSRAEKLVFLFASLNRYELVNILKQSNYTKHRKDEIYDLVHIILANWFEQLPRIPKRRWFMELDKIQIYLTHASPTCRYSIAIYLGMHL